MNILKRIGLWLDFGLNVLRGGWPTEPVSAWVWRKQYKTAIRVLDTVFFWDKDHCRKSYENVKNDVNLPVEYRNPPNA